MHQTNGDTPPEILTKLGTTILTTRLNYQPDPFWPISNSEMPDLDAPLGIAKTYQVDLVTVLSAFAEGFEQD